MNDRSELVDLLVGWNVLSGEDDREPLITSGRLDSVALFDLSLWIEEQVGRPLDPATFDFSAEWDTVDAIVSFIDRVRSGATPSAAVSTAADLPTSSVARAAASRTSRRHLPDGYEIVRLDLAARQQVLPLYARLWSTDAIRNERFFDWRYARNPAGGDPLIYAAYHEGRAVATRAAFPSRWVTPESERTWYLSDDLIVLPGHESKGIFAAFTEAIRRDLAERGHLFFVSMSALRVTRLQSMSAGARDLGGMKPVGLQPAYVAALDRIRGIARRLPVAWRLAGVTTRFESAARAFGNLDARPPRRAGDREIVATAQPLVEDMVRVAAVSGSDSRFRMLRDREFFTWRYQNPLHEYRFIYVRDSGVVSGYLVLERTLSDLGNPRRINVVEWESISQVVSDTLLETASDIGCAELVCWTETLDSSRLHALDRLGFAPVDGEQRARGLPSVLVWPVTGETGDEKFDVGGRSLLDVANWDLRMIYSSLA